MDEMELSLRRSAATKMRVTGVVLLIFGVLLLLAGAVGDRLRGVVLGIGLIAGGIGQFIRANKHMTGASDPDVELPPGF